MGRPETPERLRQIRARRQGGVFKASAADDFVDFTVDEPPTKILNTPTPKGSKKGSQMYQSTRSYRLSSGDGMHTDDGSARQSRTGSGRSRAESPMGGSHASPDSRVTSPDQHSRLTARGQSRQAPTAPARNSQRSGIGTPQPANHESAPSLRSSRESQSPASRTSMHPSLASHFPPRKGGLMVDYESDEDEESDDDGSFSATNARTSLYTRDSIMPSGTKRSLILPEILDKKLKDRFMSSGSAGLHKLFPEKRDPAVIMMNRLKQTRCVVRIAKLGDGVYGMANNSPGKTYDIPPVADLGNAVDECNSDEEDEFLLTDDLVRNLTAPPLTAARMHILNTKTDDLDRPMMTSYSQWPPRVASPTKRGPLHFSHSDHPSSLLSPSEAFPAGFQKPGTPSSQDSDDYSSRPATRDTILQTPDSFFSPSPLQQKLKPRHISQHFIGGNMDYRSRQKRRAETASATAGLMGDIPVRQGTAPASVPTLKEMRESMGKLAWVGHKQWKHENQERIRTAFPDVTLEESFDSAMTRRRLESRPMRQCYGKQHLLTNHVSHRTMAHAAEPGPEVGDSGLARHYAQTSRQAESEVVVFRRRFDTLLAASGPTLTSINLSASLSGDRNFRLLLVTLPLYPSIRELVLRNNGLDDGYMDALVDTLEEMASITTLDVSNNRLSWVSASKLGTLLKKRTRDLGGQKLQIENLQMNDNNIGNRGIELLGESLLDARHLRVLGLSKCGIAATGGRKLGQLLSEALAVQDLNLSWNELGVQGASAIASGVGFSPALKRLDLSHNFFGDGAAEAIAEGLSQTEALCHIDLSSNFLGIRTCTALGQALLNRSAASKQTLQTIVLDNNPCTVNGASMIAEFLAKTKSAMSISIQGCSFERAAPKRAFSPDDPEGQYSFSLDNPVERAEAIQLLKARNLQVPAAWHVSLLDGKAFVPLGPWDAPPPEERTEDPAEGGDKKKSKGKDKKGEEEEKELDPWDPMMAMPMDGELYVEFRNVCMPQAAKDAEDNLSVLDEAGFDRAWTLHQTQSTTDEWRVGYIRAICFRSWLSADQVVYVLDHFIQPKDKLEAAFCMFWRLLSYKEFYKIHSCLSHNLRSELYHRIGLTDLLDLRMPMGHYRLDMRMRVQNCAAHLLQFLWRREVEEEVCVGEHRHCWRNVQLDGKSVTARTDSLLPSSGVIELDFVSLQVPDLTDRTCGGLMLNGTFALMLQQLTNSQSTMMSLGPEHFLERMKQKDEDVKREAEKEANASFKQASGRALSASAKRFAKELPEAAEEPEAPGVDDAESNEAESRPSSLEPQLSVKRMLQHMHSMIPKTKEVHPSPSVARALKASESYGQVSSPKEALNMLKAVYSHFTVDLEQLMILLQCFNHSPDAKLKLLKKLYCRLEEREATMGSVVMFGLTAEERDQIIHSVGILNIISKAAPNFEYELSMRKPDHRFCLYMLLQLSASGGSIDIRMVEPLRVNGNLTARRRFGNSELWDGLLGDHYWNKLNLHMQATSSRLGNMWQWLEAGKNPHQTKTMKLLAADDINVGEEDDSPAAELELDPEPEPDPEEEERAEAEAEELAKAGAEAARLEAGKDAAPVKAPPPETEEEKEARREKRKERELKKLRLGTVKFVYEVNPEAKLKGLCLLASKHWKDWVRHRKDKRAQAAAHKIVEWYRAKKQEKELRDMQELLDLQAQAEHKLKDAGLA